MYELLNVASWGRHDPPEAWSFIGDTNILFQKDRTGILRTFPFHAMSGAGRNSQGRYDGVKEILGSKYQGLPTSILGK